MADETTQDPTQHDDAATETATEAGAELSPADGAGNDNAANGTVQPLPAADASPTDVLDAPAAGATDEQPTPELAPSDASVEGTTPAPGAEGDSPAAGADAGVGAADATTPTEPASEPVVPGLDAEPAVDTEPAPGAEPAADNAVADGSADVPADAGNAAEAAPAPAPVDADPAQGATDGAAADAPQPAPTGGEAPADAGAPAGGSDVELPFNSTGMAQLGTTGHDSGGPLQHPAPATTPRPIDPTTGLELSDDEHALVTGGLSKGDTVEPPVSPVVDNLLGNASDSEGAASAGAGAGASDAAQPEAPTAEANESESDDEGFKNRVLSMLDRLSSKLGHLEHELRHLGRKH